jgi:L-lactate dehydrogenase (cytochrome)
MEKLKDHSTEDDCWIGIHGKIYNVTSFLDKHPGGRQILLKQAGTDATAQFLQVHSLDILEMVKDLIVADCPVQNVSQVSFVPCNLDISTILNLDDFEIAAKSVLSEQAWAYYSSAADDEQTLKENRLGFGNYWIRPRILINVTSISTETSLFGQKSKLPIYITATAMGKLGHPEGEKVFTRAASNKGIVQMIPTLASCSFDEIISARSPGQVQWLQLYVNRGIVFLL